MSDTNYTGAIMDAMGEDEFVKHFGVKGMRWGKRKAVASSPTGTDDRPTRRERSNAVAKARIERNNGSKAKAYGGVVARNIALNIITNAGGMALNQTVFKDNPAAQKGVVAVGSLIQGGAFAKSVSDALAIRRN